MKATEEQIKTVSKMLAVAYWLGRLESLKGIPHDHSLIEAIPKASPESDTTHPAEK